MDEITRIILFFKLIILSIIIILAGIYTLPIIFISRFHTVTNLLTCKLCLVSVFGCIYWGIHTIFDGFYPGTLHKYHLSCLVVPYFQVVVNCLIINAFLMITINRFFQIIYGSKRLFKRRQWLLISFVIHWLVAFILPLPYFALSFKVIIKFESYLSLISLVLELHTFSTDTYLDSNVSINDRVHYTFHTQWIVEFLYFS